MLVGGGKKKAAPPPKSEQSNAPPEPNEELVRFIENRDYTGAQTFITFLRDELNLPYTKEFALWHGYSLFHSGQYYDAIQVYEKLLKSDSTDPVLHLYIASCYYYNQEFAEARQSALRGPESDLRTRLIFHIAHQLNDEQELLHAHSQLVGTLENQLSLAAIHYMRSHYQDAVDVYQRLLLQHSDFTALNVYIAMCQFKLEEFDPSNEAVDLYLSGNSDSAIALNLKSCDYFRLFGQDIAESQLLQIRKFSSAAYDFVDSLVTHNLCVFANGVDGFTILPKLVHALPEARYNLAVLYMRQNNPTEANEVLQDFAAVQLNESILKGTVLLALGQATSEASQIEEANTIFSEIGSMDVVKDTVPGRECLASTKFIVGEYEETLRVLDTIAQHVSDVDEYNYDRGMTLASLSRWPEAERALLMVKNAAYTKEVFYTSWLCRCFIKNKRPDAAWNLYLDASSTEDSKTLLKIVASDCFQSGLYFYAMRAYDVLAKFEPDPSFKDGLVASAVGVFRGVLTRKETADKLMDVINALAGEPSASSILQAIQQYQINSGEYSNMP
jgi:intraflagellar transport protein 56